VDQPVGLRHAGVVLTVKDIVKDSKTDKIIEIKATYQNVTDGPKPKGFIHWVSKPIPVEVRQYDRL